MKWWKLQSGDSAAVQRALKSRYPEYVFECEDGVQPVSGQRTVEVKITGMFGLNGGIVQPIVTAAKAEDLFNEASKVASYFVHIWVVDAEGGLTLRSPDPLITDAAAEESASSATRD